MVLYTFFLDSILHAFARAADGTAPTAALTQGGAPGAEAGKALSGTRRGVRLRVPGGPRPPHGHRRTPLAGRPSCPSRAALAQWQPPTALGRLSEAVWAFNRMLQF